MKNTIPSLDRTIVTSEKNTGMDFHLLTVKTYK